MGRLGIGDSTAVVAYDDAGGTVAARLVWMLRALGGDAALLDGGLAAWPGPLETGPPSDNPAADFTARPWPAARLATIDEVATAEEPGSKLVLLDARPPERYRGEVEPVDPRAGHIPGARNVPFTANLHHGRFRAPEALRATYLAAGAAEDADVICSCGSGVTACHDLLALEHAGLPPGRLFVGSWSQWSNDPDRPAATGEEP
jgi:thiosulfate/3-mercaptopyruvate sulfurtransferase